MCYAVYESWISDFLVEYLTEQEQEAAAEGADSDITELENLKRSLSQVMGKEKLERQQSKVISIKSSHKTRSSMFSATRWVIFINFSEQ